MVRLIRHLQLLLSALSNALKPIWKAEVPGYGGLWLADSPQTSDQVWELNCVRRHDCGFGRDWEIHEKSLSHCVRGFMVSMLVVPHVELTHDQFFILGMCIHAGASRKAWNLEKAKQQARSRERDDAWQS